MIINEKNSRIADEIIEILVKEKCTVAESSAILHEIVIGIGRSSTVQMTNYQQLFKNLTEQKES